MKKIALILIACLVLLGVQRAMAEDASGLALIENIAALYDAFGDNKEEKAKTLAHTALLERGIPCEGDQFNVYVSFVITGQEPGVYPYWAVYYTDVEKGRLQYSVQLSAETGDILNVQTQDWMIPGKG